MPQLMDFQKILTVKATLTQIMSKMRGGVGISDYGLALEDESGGMRQLESDRTLADYNLPDSVS